MKHRLVPKLNWSCPSDAVWQSIDNTLRCCSVNEIFLLLKSSDKINHDLSCPFEYSTDCDENDFGGLTYYLGLGSLHSLNFQ
jgi:hypothetical protein